MTTFSQLVDSVVEDTRRPDLRTTIGQYVNQQIRELHIGPNGAAMKYNDNLVEIELTADDARACMARRVPLQPAAHAMRAAHSRRSP